MFCAPNDKTSEMVHSISHAYMAEQFHISHFDSICCVVAARILLMQRFVCFSNNEEKKCAQTFQQDC
jgi:hypothetical protein